MADIDNDKTQDGRKMEFYLVRLSYTADAWHDLISSTTSLDQRLAPVRSLINHLGGSLATFHFFDAPHFSSAAKPPVVVTDKFAMMGEHDLLTILAVPDKSIAQAFNMIISAEPGLKTVDLISMMPLADAIAVMPTAKAAIQATGYLAPGRKRP
jgi:uncharacterized protein with GYD domain